MRDFYSEPNVHIQARSFHTKRSGLGHYFLHYISVNFRYTRSVRGQKKKGACERDLNFIVSRDGHSPTLRQSEPRAASLCITLRYETLPSRRLRTLECG